jgi:hypothetical protein
MQAFKCTDDLRSIEPCPLLCELDFFPEMPKQFPSVQEVHDKVQLVISLKGIVKINYEWVLDLFQNLSFSYSKVQSNIVTFSLNSEVS